MFFGWYVVGGTFVAQMLVVGFFTYSVSLIVPFVREEFAVSLSQVMYSLTFGTVLGMVVMPLVGVLLDRYPVRWLMAVGAAAMAAGLWLLAHSATITQFIIIFGITMSVANALASSIASQTVISRWFTSSRGRALGISAIGTSVGGMLIPKLVAIWLAAGGWRVALENLSLLSALFMLPVIILTVRGKPQDIGLLPEQAQQGQASALGNDPQLGLADLVRMPPFWLIGIALGLLFTGYASLLANFTPYALDRGATADQASNAIMTLAVCGLLGKLLFGFAADKMNLKVGMWLSMALLLAAYLLLAAEPGLVLVFVAAALLGLSTGGMLPIWGSMMARVFGLVSYGRAMGLMSPLFTLFIIPGYAIIGALYDATGSYRPSLLLFAALLVVAMAVLLPVKLSDSKA